MDIKDRRVIMEKLDHRDLRLIQIKVELSLKALLEIQADQGSQALQEAQVSEAHQDYPDYQDLRDDIQGQRVLQDSQVLLVLKENVERQEGGHSNHWDFQGNLVYKAHQDHQDHQDHQNREILGLQTMGMLGLQVHLDQLAHQGFEGSMDIKVNRAIVFAMGCVQEEIKALRVLRENQESLVLIAGMDSVEILDRQEAQDKQDRQVIQECLAGPVQKDRRETHRSLQQEDQKEILVFQDQEDPLEFRGNQEGMAYQV